MALNGYWRGHYVSLCQVIPNEPPGVSSSVMQERTILGSLHNKLLCCQSTDIIVDTRLPYTLGLALASGLVTHT